MKVGITGHQKLGSPDQISKLKQLLTQVISEEDITMGYTSLAKGADQLFAEILYKAGYPYCVVIPSENYDTTFEDEETLNKYNAFVQNADKNIVLSFNQPEEQAFYDAGKYIVKSSDMMIAIWDGEVAKGLGGTADIVKYCSKLNKKVIHINPIDLTISLLNIN